MSIYNYLVKKPNGDILSMQTYENKVMLIVNTASECQFTYQYEDMQKLYSKLNSKGLEILAFPSDQFGNQNPEDDETTATRCTTQFGVQYNVFNKVEVNGPSTHPLFNYLKHSVDYGDMPQNTMQQKMLFDRVQKFHPSYLIGNNIRWNFTKFLVDRDGNVIKRFEPDDSILDIEEAITALL